jgi:DNA phosphorothioation-dependent restriction protein DptG
MAIEFKKTTSNDSVTKVAEFISYLFSCRTVLHILHLKTNKYSVHKALDSAYSGILEITDSIAEKSSGYLKSHLQGFKDYPIQKYENTDPSTYIQEVKDYVQTQRYIAFDKNYSPIQNELDNLTNLLDETTYLLTLS